MGKSRAGKSEAGNGKREARSERREPQRPAWNPRPRGLESPRYGGDVLPVSPSNNPRCLRVSVVKTVTAAGTNAPGRARADPYRRR